MNFDHVIFITSTDCFSGELLGERFAANLDDIKYAARAETLEIMKGGSDYYYDADFSENRVAKTQNDFFQRLAALKDSGFILSKFSELYEVVSKQILNENANSIRLIKNVSIRLYWLDIDEFQIEVSDALIEAVMQVQNLDLPLEAETDLDWDDIDELWEEASTDWDKYMKGVMSDVPDALCAIFNELYNSPLSLSHLYLWKDKLQPNQFLTLIQAIEDEAFLEMEKINKDYALLVRPAMKQFYE